jgi:peptidoglycan/LPS O-acetylase OafA/YrhL
MASRRVPELDGVRGVAILLVVFWHYVAAPNHLAAPGSFGWLLHKLGMFSWSGVDLFFVLSGYLIGGILVDAKEAPGYFKAFYLRRAFRILPLYVLFCGVGAAIVTMAPALQSMVGPPMPVRVYATFTQNFWLAHHPWDRYMDVTWSLAVEEQFYLTLPFVIRFVPRQQLPRTIGALVLASLIGRSLFYLHYGSEWGTAAYTLMPCRADALMLGTLGALAVRSERARRFLVQRPWPLPIALGASGLAVATLAFRGWDMNTRPMSTLGYTCLGVFYLTLLLWAVLRQQGWWAAVMRWRPLMVCGQLAYCLYLVHGLALHASAYLLRGSRAAGPDWLAAGVGLGVAFAFSALSWRYFESKMIAIGHRFSYAGDAVAAAPVARAAGR